LLKYIGIIVLIFSCSAIFISLKVSINHFYGIKPHFESGKKKFLVNLISRLISFALLAGMGILLVVTYFIQFVFNSVGKLVLKNHAFMSDFWFEIVQHSVSILSMMIFLMFVYKYLNDAVVKFRVAFVGAFFAAVLLQLGQIGIQYYMNVAYFAKSGSLLSVILIILAFVYYGSQAIFIGASISAAYGELVEEPIVSRYNEED
jgi:membrane protein